MALPPQSFAMSQSCMSPVTPPLSSPGAVARSPSKKRRLRLRALAEARGREKEQVENTGLLERIRALENAVKVNAESVDASFCSLSESLPNRATVLQSSGESGPIESDQNTGGEEPEVQPSGVRKFSCPRCHTEVEDEASACWCFELVCFCCQALALVCVCDRMTLMVETCDTCSHINGVPGSSLSTLSQQGYDYGAVQSLVVSLIQARSAVNV